MHCSGQPKSTYVISRLEGVTNVPKELEGSNHENMVKCTIKKVKRLTFKFIQNLRFLVYIIIVPS